MGKQKQRPKKHKYNLELWEDHKIIDRITNDNPLNFFDILDKKFGPLFKKLKRGK